MISRFWRLIYPGNIDGAPIQCLAQREGPGVPRTWTCDGNGQMTGAAGDGAAEVHSGSRGAVGGVSLQPGFSES